MKISSLRAFSLLLLLSTQIFAQRFTATEPDIFITGRYSSTGNYGYVAAWQSAALGEKNSSYANLMLLRGRDTLVYPSDAEKRTSYKVVNSYGQEFGDIYPTSLKIQPYSFVSPTSGETAYDNRIGGVVVLDSFSDNKKKAVVAFASLRKLIIAELTINNLNKVEYSILATVEMQGLVSQADSSYRAAGASRRITLLETGKIGNDKVYHIAMGNPLYKNGVHKKSGRVDFFSIRENLWTVTQQNANGIDGSGAFFFLQNSAFGTDLVSVGDLDGNGHNELAVLLPASTQFPNGAIYIFFMNSENTLAPKEPVILAGSSMPWKENFIKDHEQDCNAMSFVKWNDESHLLLACNAVFRENSFTSMIAFVKDIVLNAEGNIAYTSTFSAEETAGTNKFIFSAISNPIPIKKHKSDNFAIAQSIQGPCYTCDLGNIYVYQVADADASKNFSIEIGRKEIIAAADSLFYKSKAEGYSFKTLAGLTECNVDLQNKLYCQAGDNARSTWSMIELTAWGDCEPYRVCKKKDTIHVYARGRIEPANTALRIPSDIVIPMQNGIFTIEELNSFAFFRNPESLNTNLSWNQTGLQYGTVFGNSDNQVSVIPIQQGVDTLVFNMSVSSVTDKYPIRLHLTDTSVILKNAIPATPGNDTVWNTAQKKYIALPRSNSNGSLYTYDVFQSKLGSYAEVAGDYLHILDVDVADISIHYTENKEEKLRKITLMPEAKALPSSSSSSEPTPSSSSSEPTVSVAVGALTQSLKAAHTGGGLQISGLNGEFEIRAYNFKGEEIQREKANTQGSVFVKLRQNCPQVVQIKTSKEKIHLKIVN